MSSDKNDNNISNRPIMSTDTDLHLDLFADPSKLKPMTNVINISKNLNNSEDSHIIDKAILSDDETDIKMQTSCRRTENKPKIESIKSSSRSSSRSSSKTSSRASSRASSKSSTSSIRSEKKYNHLIQSENNRKLNNIMNEYNKNTETRNTDIRNTDIRNTENNSSNDKNIIETNNMPNVYIPKFQTERELRFRKMELLCILKNIKKSGRELSKEYTINSEIEDMEMEVRFHTDNEQKKVSVNFAKDGLLKMCQFFEIMNNNFDPFGINLKGWHSQMASNVDNYETVFEELYEKYKNYVGRVEPEYKLLYMVFGSAASFHYSKQFVDQFGLDKIIKNNPELLEKIQANIASTMEKQIGKKDESLQKKNTMPSVSQHEMYQQMLKEKEKDNKNDIEMKKPSKLADLLSKVKSTTNKELLIPLENSQTSISSRMKVINTLDSESINDSDNLNISNLRKSRKQRNQII